MAIQYKMTVLFDGSKVDAIGTVFNFTSSRPGGVAQGSEGPIDQFAGRGETHRLEGVTLRIRPTGPTFSPWDHTDVGTEFELQMTQGDPLLGGRVVTYQNCLCEGEVTRANNENGDIQLEIPAIRAVRRVG